jgi:hypothetical protein
MLFRRKQKRFCRGREPLFDIEFVDNVGAGDDQAANCIAVRRAMAGMCRIPPEMVRDTDDIRELCRLMFDGWDDLDFCFRLEKELNVKVACSRIPHPDISWKFLIWGEDKGQAFGEWAKQVFTALATESTG